MRNDIGEQELNELIRLQAEQRKKFLAGEITIEHIKWFNGLNFWQRRWLLIGKWEGLMAKMVKSGLQSLSRAKNE
ncbi:MAG: hypothetical protein KGL67_00900 [Patescibacteria group bacterium]|nr:hypothetical protein [Patescibacteria group bacterium]